MNNINRLTEYLQEYNIIPTDEQLSKFLKYYELLVEKNKFVNLTAITDFDEVLIKHFTDSLSLVKAVEKEKLNKQGLRLLDIGTGAGFPGIPLKIILPNLNITLLDSLNKRVDFLNEVINTLELNSEYKNSSITAVHSRAEDFIKQDGIRESYDFVVSRAVSALPALCEYCIPYVRMDGLFIPYKAESAKEELEAASNALNILGAEAENTITFNLPGKENISRTLIKIRKTRPTPDKYPRKAGLPTKKPL